MRHKSIEEVRDDFYRRGVTFADWARQHGYRYSAVIAVLNGRVKCRTGQSHEIAIALGLKPAA